MIRVDRPRPRLHPPRGEGAAPSSTRSGARTRPGGRCWSGTLTVEESERLAARLGAAGIACEVLNAKNDDEEARIVARAGALGAVTISTNMAGRGTDIRLGGEDEADHERVAALGGLYVIGTNRHESRRVDQQLRGRAGRQGDPGESRFFVSLEDDLLVRYGIRALDPAGRVAPAVRRGRSTSRVVRREIARAQRIVEGQNFEIRRTLCALRRRSSRSSTAMLIERRQALLAATDRRTSGSARRSAAPRSWRRLARAAVVEPSARSRSPASTAPGATTWRCCADLREGIHLVRLGGQDPLTALHERGDPRRSRRSRTRSTTRARGARTRAASPAGSSISAALGSRRPRPPGPTSSTTTRSGTGSARC